MKNHQETFAVVVKGWPRLSETFIAQELLALEACGHEFEIWSLRFPTDKKRHPMHNQIKARVRYLPEYLYQEPLRIVSAYLKVRNQSGFKQAWQLFKKDFSRDRSSNRIRRFGQALVLAAELPENVNSLYAHFMHTPASVARYCAAIKQIPWSFSAHAKDIWTSPEWEKREKLDTRTYGASFAATCTGSGAQHLKSLAENPDKVNLVYHGLDLTRFPPPPKKQWDGDGKAKPIYYLSVGRLVEKKGFDRLIAALALLPKDLDWHWTHIGGGNLKSSLSVQAKKAGIDKKITWLGAQNQPEVISAMRKSDLFILPSRIAEDGDRDGLPNVLMEAASQNLTILSTPVSAIPEFIISGKNGVLCPDEPEQFSKAILQLTDKPTLRKRYAGAALKTLKSFFGMQAGISLLNTKLRQLAKRQKDE